MLSLIFYTRALFAVLVLAVAAYTLTLCNPAIAKTATIIEVKQKWIEGTSAPPLLEQIAILLDRGKTL